ncbi:MAG: hypothetical protein AzoDbin1_04097 [Azoarcus sp.]|nr:hypothetical protein [Azoarcus sp.]
MDVPYPLPTHQPYSADKIKQLFQAAGVPVSTWAESNGYSRRDVYMLLNGQFKGKYGRGHELAIKLGMKLPVKQLAA